MPLHYLQEFFGVEVGCTLNPWVQWISCDCIELFIGCQEVMTAIVYMYGDFVTSDDVEVFLAEVVGGCPGHEWFDFDNAFSFYCWINGHRARSYSSSAADDKNRLRMSRDKRGEMSEHALESHVAWHVRGLNLARDMKCPDGVREIRNGNRQVQPFARINNIPLADPCGRKSAVRDEYCRYRRNAVNQQTPGYDCNEAKSPLSRLQQKQSGQDRQ